MNYLAKYIGREKLYSRVKGLGYMLPDMDAMLYSKLVGIEWLELEHIELSSQQTGNWIKIYNKDTCKNDVYVGFNGHDYQKHYINGKLVQVKKVL